MSGPFFQFARKAGEKMGPDDAIRGGLAHLEAIRDRAAGALPASAGSVLEAGCGTGEFLARVPPAPRRRVVGVDIRRWMTDADVGKMENGKWRMENGGARASPAPSSPIVQSPFSFLRADVAFLPFRDGAFDAVFCVNTLQVLEARRARRGLSELARVARAGGRVVVTFPNRFNPALRLRLWARAATYQGGGRPHAFYASDLFRRLRAAGAAVAGIEAVVVPPYGAAHSPLGASLRRRLAERATRWIRRAPHWAPVLLVTAVKRADTLHKRNP